MARLVAALMLLCCLVQPGLAQTPAGDETGRLVTGLSTNRIAITSNFTGSEIVLFGTVEGIFERPRDYDVVVVIEGPRRDVMVRRKDRFLGIWLNAEGRELENAPTSLYVLTSAPLSQIATPETIAGSALNLEARLPDAASRRGGETFRQALIRLKSDQRLYAISLGGVEFLSDMLFRASIRVPAAIPVGQHKSEVYLLRGGVVVARDTLPIVIEKQGLEEASHTLAVEHSLLYGILAVVIAFFMGWAANIIFRKD